MSAAVLRALAARCECEGPSRKLDAAIAPHVGWKKHGKSTDEFWWIEPGCTEDDPSFMHRQVHTRPPPWTGSLDSAVTLVPEGVWSVSASWSESYGAWHVALCGPGRGASPLNAIHGAQAKTEPMARCAAALRARAAIAGDGK